MRDGPISTNKKRLQNFACIKLQGGGGTCPSAPCLATPLVVVPVDDTSKLPSRGRSFILGQLKRETGNRETGQRGTKLQDWKTQDWKTRERISYGKMIKLKQPTDLNSRR